jgi:hypothetical protein
MAQLWYPSGRPIFNAIEEQLQRVIFALRSNEDFGRLERLEEIVRRQPKWDGFVQFFGWGEIMPARRRHSRLSPLAPASGIPEPDSLQR